MMTAGNTHPKSSGLEQMAKFFKADIEVGFSAKQLFQCLFDAHAPIIPLKQPVIKKTQPSLWLIIQARPEPLFHISQIHAFAAVVVQDLIAVQFSDAEIF